MRLLFFGTPTFALPSLKILLQSRHPMSGIVTPPDRPKGRSRKTAPSPVKQAAQEAGLAILQPSSLNDPAFLQKVQSLRTDVAVVVAFGRILPRPLLQTFPKGAYNLHASLLPKFRGAAPIQWALICGESETGVTVFRMDEQLDHGPILLQAAYPVDLKDTALTLTQALAELGGQTLLKALDLLEAQAAQWTPQDESRVTQAPALKKEDGVIHWSKDCLSIHNQIRGVQPWPGALTWLSNRLLKIFSTHPDSNRQDPVARPGTVVLADPIHGLWIQTGRGQIRIRQLQAAGGKTLEAAAFLRGHAIPPKSQLTSSPAV